MRSPAAALTVVNFSDRMQVIHLAPALLGERARGPRKTGTFARSRGTSALDARLLAARVLAGVVISGGTDIALGRTGCAHRPWWGRPFRCSFWRRSCRTSCWNGWRRVRRCLRRMRPEQAGSVSPEVIAVTPNNEAARGPRLQAWIECKTRWCMVRIQNAGIVNDVPS
jgi:hypothetical protein